MTLWINQQTKNLPLEINNINNIWHVKIKNKAFKVNLSKVTDNIASCIINDSKLDFGWSFLNGVHSITINGYTYDVRIQEYERLFNKSQLEYKRKRLFELRSPIPGLISDIAVKEGDYVTHNQHLLTLDAMKMQNEIVSPVSGKISKICAGKGQTVEKNQLLLVIT